MTPPKDTNRLWTLSPADVQAIDALMKEHLRREKTAAEMGGQVSEVESQGMPEKVGGTNAAASGVSGEISGEVSGGARTRGAQKLLELLAKCSADEPAEDLVSRTLARTTQEEQRREVAMRIQSLSTPAVIFRWRELISVAAVVMIGLSLLWPALARSREQARQLACANNLGAAGQALAGYAVDHAGMMPRLAANNNGIKNWSTVGGNCDTAAPANSNPAHLYLLARKGYINPHTLACPDNPEAPKNMTADMYDWPHAAAVSYSYQNQFTPEQVRLDRTPDMAVLADKNPLFTASQNDPCRVVFRMDVAPNSPSAFHARRGQNILLAGGTLLWSSDPVIRNGDNIWLAEGVQTYTGNEAPSTTNDSFLIP